MSSESGADNWLQVTEVAEMLDLKEVTIKRYAREGLLNGKKENNEWQFLTSDIEKFKAIQAKL
ncbi:MAG: helix-turn-helix domain-containing protein [Oleispira sp.]|nr:helix-turn-helix domain-containing protein [Oleispira sp.]MBL4881235.1 helix-turn-helix domain-containing protein [Oleispira sp.]